MPVAFANRVTEGRAHQQSQDEETEHCHFLRVSGGRKNSLTSKKKRYKTGVWEEISSLSEAWYSWLSQGKTITNLGLTKKGHLNNKHVFTLIYECGDWWWNVNGTSTSRQGKIKLRKPIFVFVLEITACTRRSKFWAVGKNFSVWSLTSVKRISSF